MDETFDLNYPLCVYGAFWRPECPGEKFTGRLARSGKNIDLTTSPIFKEILETSDYLADPYQREEIGALHGFTTLGPCTLLWLQSLGNGGLMDVEAGKALQFREYRVGLSLLGLHMPNASFFTSAQFSYSGLQQWMPVHPRLEVAEDSSTIVRTRNLPPIFDFSLVALKARFRFKILTNVTHRYTGEFRSQHRPSLLIETAEPKSIEWFLNLADRMENLFSLLLGTSVNLTSAGFSAGSKIGWVIRAVDKKFEKTNRSFFVNCTGTQLIKAISCWLSMPAKLEPLENLIYGTIRRSSLFVETEFLSLAQALESMHRITDSDGEPTFRQRVESLMSRISENGKAKLLGNPECFESTLRQTRNHFTHPGIEQKSDVLTSAPELFLFNQKVHAMLRLLMLLHVGFSEEQVFEPVYRQATNWR